MRQNDLKAGMMVSLRHVAHNFIVMCDCFIHGQYYLKAIVSLKPSQTVYSLSAYKNDLTHDTDPDLDIMDVFWPSKIPFNGVEVSEYKSIWQRPTPVDFLSAAVSLRRIRLSDPSVTMPSLNDFQDVANVLTELSLLSGATRKGFMLSKWLIEPTIIEPEVPSPPVTPIDGGEE